VIPQPGGTCSDGTRNNGETGIDCGGPCIDCIEQADYYVATNGNDNNPGTITQPWKTWQKAFSTAQAGDLVYIRGGTYMTTATDGTGIWVSNSGTVNNPIRIFNYPGEQPILDCSNVVPNNPINMNYGIRMQYVSNIHLKGLEIKNVRQTSPPILVFGIYANLCDNLTFENLKVHDTGDSGIKITSVNHVTYKNCDTWNNDDHLTPVYPGGGGTGMAWDNVVYLGMPYEEAVASVVNIIGCRSWNNSDNGFGGVTDGTLIVNDSWAFDNGLEATDLGDGVGWKFSYGFPWEQTPMIKYITHSISAHNAHTGFSENQDLVAPSMHMRFNNNIAYQNGIGALREGQNGGGFQNYPARDAIQDNWYRNNIAYKNVNGHGQVADVHFWGGAQTEYNSWNTPPGVTVTDSDFVSLDVNQLYSPRNANGSLPTNITFGHLRTDSDLINKGVNVGLPYSGSAPDLGAFEYS
jgi:hypothetical protein